MQELLILLVMLFLSAFFSGSETALTALTASRVEALFKEGRRGSQALHLLKANSDRMLITLLIGNNLVNIGASAIATVVATEHFGRLGPGLAVGVLTLFILIFGEIMPKTFAVRNKVAIGLMVAPPLRLFYRIVFPLVWLLEHLTSAMQHLQADGQSEPTITETELLSLARHGAAEGVIEADEEQMIKRVFELNDLCAADIMVPRSAMVVMNGKLTVAEALPDLLQQPYGRIPLMLDNPGEIQRVIYIRDVLEAMVSGNQEQSLLEIAHDPIFVPLNQRVDDLLEQMRGRKEKLVIVVDDLGMAQGLFTLEDILEEVVGEIYDESDPPLHVLVHEKSNGCISVDGTTELRHVQEYFGINLGGKSTDRISFWILQHIERIPEPGESFWINGLRVEVERANRRRIIKVLLTYSKKEPAPASA
uniref:HlyC/CorC family transporter n=1 Tax=Magnetococcus massalia (strain MO-1) TaxID=451514 RepID=A0A1S7LK62_MAGMO|nr:Conserved membrane protein of unknown function [Candidatus Magnetococcus massalia]